MQDIVAPVLLGAFALLFVPTLLAVLATDGEVSARLERHGASVGGVSVAVVASTGLVLVLFRFGTVPPNRGFALPVVGLYVSMVGLVVGLGYTRRLVGLLRAGRVRTGYLRDGRVAVTGVVECDSPSETPFFGREAVAWEWAVWAKNRHGTRYEGRRAWTVERSGSGGVPFTLDDGSGPVSVDPADARLGLHDERSETYPPGETPGRAATVADLELGGERFRFVERVLEPGRTATAVGLVSAGRLGARDSSLVVASGTASDLRWRTALVATGIGGASLAGTWFCLDWLAGALGVAVPV